MPINPNSGNTDNDVKLMNNKVKKSMLTDVCHFSLSNAATTGTTTDHTFSKVYLVAALERSVTSWFTLWFYGIVEVEISNCWSISNDFFKYVTALQAFRYMSILMFMHLVLHYLYVSVVVTSYI